MKNLLFSNRLQKPALFLLLFFALLAFLNMQFNFELPFLKMAAPKDSLLSNDNLSDELFLGGFLLSLTVYGFCRERDEDEYTTHLRFRSLVYAVLIHTLISLLLIAFVYGWAFPVLAVYHLFTVLLLYILFYKGSLLYTRAKAIRAS